MRTMACWIAKGRPSGSRNPYQPYDSKQCDECLAGANCHKDRAT
jgi:hypothetical protein